MDPDNLGFWGVVFFYIFWSPVLGTLLSLVILVLTVPFGLVWAPFGALISRRIALSRGLEPRRYAIAGAVYSILFFLPWVYLVMRMRGRSVSFGLVRNIYILLYGTWLVLSIFPLFMWMFFYFDYEENFGKALPLLFMLILSILMFVGSLVMIARVRKRDKSEYRTAGRPFRSDESIPDDVLPHIAYILPFAYLIFWFAALPLYLLWGNPNGG